MWIVFLRSCMSGGRSQTSPTRILNLLKKSRHKSQYCTLCLLSYSTGLCIHAPIAHPHSQVPPVRSCFYSVVWEQHQGAVPNPILNTCMDTAWGEAHSWVCAPCWLVETLISLCTQGPWSPLQDGTKHFLRVASPDEFLMLSSSSSVHVLLSMPTPQRWVLDFLCPGIHASLLGMAAFPSLACSWCSCSLGFLTPGEQSRGRQGHGVSRFGSCVCADGKNRFSPYWPVLPKDGDCFSGEVHSFLF